MELHNQTRELSQELLVVHQNTGLELGSNVGDVGRGSRADKDFVGLGSIVVSWRKMDYST